MNNAPAQHDVPHLNEHFDSWIGRTLKDESGHKVGKVTDIYTDDDTGQPEWLAVNTGLFGSNVSFVPVNGAALAGDDLQVPFPKDQVKQAPNAGADGVLSSEEEARLYAHFGYDYDQERVRLQRWVDADRAEHAGPTTGDERRSTWAEDEEVFNERQEPTGSERHQPMDTERHQPMDTERHQPVPSERHEPMDDRTRVDAEQPLRR